MDIFNMEDLIISLSQLHKLFDVVRIIDPINQQVIDYESKDNTPGGSACYDLWKRETQCDDCVVERAFLENHALTKIEYNENKIFMITAVPVEIEDKRYIVEMLKDITTTSIITDIETGSIKESNELIAELNKKVVTDDLTGLYNRRYINERLPIEIYKARTNNQRFSIVMLDIDCFKEVNDTYGHLAGDIVIQKLGRIMTICVRKETDWVARYGGEEFLIFLKDTDKKAAYKVAEKIRKTLEKEVIRYENHDISVTISIGTYTIASDIKGFNEVIKSVDENLYKAKSGGRNRTVSS